MMQEPTEYELQHLLQYVYDPVKAHEYYEKHKKLKGRRRGSTRDTSSGRRPSGQDPRTGHTRQEITRNARARQRKELKDRIQSLALKLGKLQGRIKELEAEERRENRKSKAKKERAAKEKEKPDTAAEKSKKARESKKYREKHQQSQKSKESGSKSGGGSKKKSGSDSKSHKLSELKSLATRVRGKIAVAKQKLAAL